jgi:hypothetical protein
MGNIRIREGGVTVELSDVFDRIARDTIERLIPGAIALLEAEIREVHAIARSEWPIKTGKSSAGLKVFTEIRGEELRVGIENSVPYAVWVRPKEWFGSTTAWQRLVRGRVVIVNREISKKLGPVIIEAMRKAANGG